VEIAQNKCKHKHRNKITATNDLNGGNKPLSRKLERLQEREFAK